MPQPSHNTVINISTPIIPIYTTNSPGIFYYYCSSPILHIAPLSFFQPRLIRTPCAVPHLRLVLGVGATHLLLYDIGSFKSYPGLRRERCVKISIGWCRNPYRHQAETTYYTWIYSTQRHSARYISTSHHMVYR